MMLVPTELRPSALHGVGVFARRPIKAGTPVWAFDPAVDLYLEPEAVAGVDAGLRRVIDHYGTLERDTGRWLFSFDNARFMNHSRDPNVDCRASPNVALRDIAAGEELTCDYRQFDASGVEEPNGGDQPSTDQSGIDLSEADRSRARL